ncbi:endolytic transglycosylase MltG [uncultured Psychrosphaera sp.]|uniref:endolytic transglycosylase MltG n=1 Tax=uncultured Psychrosphaera sp. TaxID=1403522 RepID=UPI0030FAE848
MPSLFSLHTFKFTNKTILSVIILFIVCMTAILFGVLRVSYTQPINLDSPKLIQLKKGDSLYTVCNRLIEHDYINDCLGVKVFSKINPVVGKVKTGVYALTPGLALNQFVANLNEGKEQQFSFTLLEGDNIYQVLDKLKHATFLVNDIKTMPLPQLSQKLLLTSDTPEGWLYPDTYYYSAYTDASALLLRAVNKQQEILAKLWQQKQAGLPISTPYEALILASIVEKESAVAAEREIIASVFHNRLNKKMRLQTDPTVIYGVWDEYKGDITRKHLKQTTPYNTYRINGLPPTPIANPSKASIEAVLHPASTEYYYFVASGNGGHVFNKTLADHNKSVQDYLNKSK